MFSVILSCYNHARFVVEAVESALNSPLVDEVLVVDDGSSDRSQDLLQATFRSTGKVRFLTESAAVNLGAPARWNQLARAARNEWIAPLNSDDRFCFGRFEVLAEHIRRGNPDLVFGDLIVIDESGARIGYRQSLQHGEIAWPEHMNPGQCVRDRNWLALFAIQNLAATTTNMVFRKSLFQDIGGFRDYRYVHDWDFVLRACARGNVDYLPGMTACYRQHGFNTINASRVDVETEAVRMLTATGAEIPGFDALSVGNPYLAACTSLYTTQTQQPDFLPRAARREARFVHMPVRPDRGLTVMEWRHIALALEDDVSDGVVVSHGFPGEALSVRDGCLANNCVFTQNGFERYTAGEDLHLTVIDLALCPEPDGAPDDSCSVVANRPQTHIGRRPFWRLVRVPPDPRPTVFVLPAFFAVGGVERLTLRLLTELSSLYRFVVVATDPVQRSLGSLAMELDGLADYLDLSAVVHPDQVVEALAFLRATYSPSLVWIVNGSPLQIHNAAKIRRIFADVPICDQQVYDAKSGWIAYFDKPELQSSDHFIAINSHIQREFVEHYGLGSSRVSLIHHCIDEQRFAPSNAVDERAFQLRESLGIPPSAVVFLFVGRLTPQKQPQRFVDLAVASSNDNHYFLMVGSGEYNDTMQSVVDQKAPKRFVWLRSGDDMPGLYRCADALVVTSDFEGLPCVVLEALSMERPVLAPDVGDIAKVADSFGGIRVISTASDQPRLKREFDRWSSDLQAQKAQAVFAAPRVRDHFSGVRIGQQYDALFTALLANTQRADTAERPRSNVSRPNGQARGEAARTDNAQPRVFFMHVAKTAGSTINRYVGNHYPDESVCTHVQSKPFRSTPGFAKDLRFVSGHVRALDADDCLDLSQFFWITVLRNPVHQLASHLRWIRHSVEDVDSLFMRSRPTHVARAMLKLKDVDMADARQLNAYLDVSDGPIVGLFHDCQSRFFLPADAPPKPLRPVQFEAMKNVLARFDHVGVTEHLDPFLSALARRFFWKPPEPQARLNENPRTFGLDLTDPDTWEVLERYTKYDRDLYAIALERALRHPLAST